jgi:hypothetical protein
MKKLTLQESEEAHRKFVAEKRENHGRIWDPVNQRYEDGK